MLLFLGSFVESPYHFALGRILMVSSNFLPRSLYRAASFSFEVLYCFRPFLVFRVLHVSSADLLSFGSLGINSTCRSFWSWMITMNWIPSISMFSLSTRATWVNFLECLSRKKSRSFFCAFSKPNPMPGSWPFVSFKFPSIRPPASSRTLPSLIFSGSVSLRPRRVLTVNAQQSFESPRG